MSLLPFFRQNNEVLNSASGNGKEVWAGETDGKDVTLGVSEESKVEVIADGSVHLE